MIKALLPIIGYLVICASSYAKLVASGIYTGEKCYDSAGEDSISAICMCDTDFFDYWPQCDQYGDEYGNTTNCVIGRNILGSNSVSICVPPNSNFLNNACSACNCPEYTSEWRPYRTGVLTLDTVYEYQEYYYCERYIEDTIYSCDGGYYLADDSDEYNPYMDCQRCPYKATIDGELIYGITAKPNMGSILSCKIPAGSSEYKDASGIFVYAKDCNYSE